MIRKLIKHGESSLTISLPRAYVKKNNLAKGDEINLKEVNEGLLISTEAKKDKKEISIDVQDQKEVIKKIIGAAYKCEYDIVNLSFSSYEELLEIKEALQIHFMGYEILSQGKNNIRIHKITSDDFSDFDNVIKRFFLIIKTMGNDMLSALKEDNQDWLKTTALMKNESDKLADYCRRAINSEFKSKYKRLAPLYNIIEEVEKISDILKKICFEKSKVNKTTLTIFKETLNLFDNFYKSFFKFNIKDIKELYNKYITIEKQIQNAAKKNSQEETLFHLERIINIINELNGPLMATYI